MIGVFEKLGLELRRTSWPLELRGARAYRGAAVYRHDARGATLFVIVCRTRCGISRFQLRPGKPRERFRFGLDLGNNLVAWVAGERRAAADLRKELGPPVAELDTGVDPDSRCYIG